MMRCSQATTKKTEEDAGSGRRDGDDEKSRKKMDGNQVVHLQVLIVRFRPLSGRRRQEHIKDLLPRRVGYVEATARDNCRFVEAVLYRYRTGIP